MNKASKIWIAGRTGLAGSAIERCFQRAGYHNIIGLPSKELDLRNQEATMNYVKHECPECVILAAAKVGGIQANIDAPVEFLYENLEIQNNVIGASWKNGVEKLIFLASSCIYPRDAAQPIHERYLLDGKPEPTNEGSALAKIAGLKMCEFINRQYGLAYITLMSCNLYGPQDNFDPRSSHVVAALIRKIHDAKVNQQPSVTVWGTGKPRRELMCSDDLADACLYVLEQDYRQPQFLNIGTGVDVTVRELAEKIADVVGYQGELCFDHSKPDGMPQKVLDVSSVNSFGWSAKISLAEGLERTYHYYLNGVLPFEDSHSLHR